MYVGSKKVHRSEIVKQSVDPKWNPFDIIVGDVGGLDQKLTIKCFDWDKNENKECIFNLLNYTLLISFIVTFDNSKMWALAKPALENVPLVL